DDVTVICTNANEKWQSAAKTVYVNDTAVSADKVKDNKTSLVINKSVFTKSGRYSIYVVAEGFEETNKIYKNMLGADGNRILGGDMSDPSQWVVYDEDDENLSKGSIKDGVYALDYTAGYFRDDWNCWVTWSSQLKKENISVEAGTKYVLRFEASTDLTDGRTIEIEYGKAGVEGNPKKTVVITPGESGVYEVEIDVVDALDDFYICYLLGPIGDNLQVKDNATVPHKVTIDNVSLTPAAGVEPTPEYHEGLWIRPIPAQTYTGSAIKPEIEVYHDGKLLTIKKDYTVAYKNNTNFGTATVTVTGKGNFKDKDTATFEIEKKDISDEDIIVADVYAIINNKGKVTNPKVTVKYGKKTLKNNSDYTVKYPELETEKDASGNDKIVAKDYEITISTTAVKKDKKGNPVDSVNYTGERKIKYTVRGNDTKLMSKAKVTLEKTKVDYKNNEQGEYGKGTEQPAVTVKMGNDTLTKDVDYVVSYENWDKIGKATVTVTAKDNTKYYGSKSVTYTVNGTKLAAKDLTIEGIENEYAYTGSEINVNSTLKVKPTAEGSVPFEEGKDYEVSYKTGKKLGEHTNVGTVTVTITGINAYTGSVNKTFKITAVDLTKFGTAEAPEGSAFTADPQAKYTKTGAKPEITELSFNGTDLVEKQDYTVSYSANSKVVAGQPSATMTIKGKGNFKGKITHKYEVTKASKDDVAVTAADIVMPTAFKKLKTTVKVVEPATGKALKAGTDYEKTIKYYKDEACKEEAQITSDNFNDWLNSLEADHITVYARVDIKAAGNYAGTGDEPGSLVAAFNLYSSSKKITDTKKYEIKVVTNQTAAEEDIACDKKGNPIYTGAKIEPKVTVTPKGTDTTLLKQGTDYVVSYDKNTNKGKATVTVTGIGEYGGTKSLKFTIVSADMKWYEEVTEKIATFFSNLF
ncbi:MAG: DUF1533 domain-containing protein, partial [Lachnospiraceae bacterium]|nr:DUF1533 domain-containing protein [Lachnospiraceae bacterium]